MDSLHSDKYFIRDSMFNLVELSLLARFYEEHCLPSASSGKLNQESLMQTVLKMKATEGKGRLRVAIYETDPVVSFGNSMGRWRNGFILSTVVKESKKV